MSAAVWVTDGAARDLDELYASAVEHAGMGEGDRILTRIQSMFERLAGDGPTLSGSHPLPGHPRARVLLEGGFKVVLLMRGDAVGVVAIAPVGRSAGALLLRRLLDA